MLALSNAGTGMHERMTAYLRARCAWLRQRTKEVSKVKACIHTVCVHWYTALIGPRISVTDAHRSR